MKLFKIPYSDNLFINKNCEIFSLYNNELTIVFPDIEEKYLINYKGHSFKYDKWRLIAITKYGYCDEEKFKINYKYDNPFENTEYLIESIIFYNSYALINGEKFMQSPQWNHLYCNKCGVIYSTKSKRFKKHSIDRDGYHRVTIDGSTTNYAVHRIVYSCWNQIILDKDLIVHHKDSDKSNNFYLNLEYTSSFQNTRYSILLKEKKLDVYYNESDIHKMCKMMSDGKSYREIAQEFNVDINNEKAYKNFRNRLNLLLQHKSSWVDISSQYDFTGYTGNKDPNTKYTSEDIANIHRLRNEGKTCVYIADLYGTTAKYISAICSGKKRPNG